ncbi:RILP-like protein 1 [Genypterus blacodes]|uniref:RILP-like protein 1 n=1 Tax=Genypterus blacodes TaxID=154954 RepID=UPI003F762145
METSGVSALDRPATELTVMDVYDIAAALGQEFERIIDRFGCESLVGLVPKVVRVLEQLEALVSRGATGQEAEELRGELDRLRQERSDRCEQERKHQKELELVEDAWRGEAQDLRSQITQLQAENKRLLVSLSLKETPAPEEDLQRQEGLSEKEQQVMKRLKDMVDKQRDKIKAKDHELMLRNEDVEALQSQQHRLIRINQDLRHRSGVMEAQGKALIQQRVELEAAAQARLQELGALQREVSKLRKEHSEWELEREAAEIEATSLIGMSPPTPAQARSSVTQQAESDKPNSLWMECGGDPGFLAKCFESDKSPSNLMSAANRDFNVEEGDEEEDLAALSLTAPDEEEETEEEKKEEEEEAGEEPDKPRFTLEELRDVLQERNELKSQLFLLQEELAYYKSEEMEDDFISTGWTESAPPCSAPTEQPESGIKRLIFTAIMPMVAAGLLADDPTLLPIRPLISFV